MSRLFAVVIAGVALTAGQVSATATADPGQHPLDVEFSLDGGATASIQGQDIDVRFSDVLEDSRCPAQVACFWTGQARIELVVTTPGREPTTVDFNTNPAPDLNVRSVRVDDVAIDLLALDPYPQTPDDGLELADYRATLVVRSS